MQQAMKSALAPLFQRGKYAIEAILQSVEYTGAALLQKRGCNGEAFFQAAAHGLAPFITGGGEHSERGILWPLQ